MLGWLSVKYLVPVTFAFMLTLLWTELSCLLFEPLCYVVEFPILTIHLFPLPKLNHYHHHHLPLSNGHSIFKFCMQHSEGCEPKKGWSQCCLPPLQLLEYEHFMEYKAIDLQPIFVCLFV